MKQIRLVPDPPFYNSVDIAVLDFPAGLDGAARRRCKITVEFAEVDVRQLQARGLDHDGALTYYHDWLYQVVKVHLSAAWTRSLPVSKQRSLAITDACCAQRATVFRPR